MHRDTGMNTRKVAQAVGLLKQSGQTKESSTALARWAQRAGARDKAYTASGSMQLPFEGRLNIRAAKGPPTEYQMQHSDLRRVWAEVASTLPGGRRLVDDVVGYGGYLPHGLRAARKAARKLPNSTRVGSMRFYTQRQDMRRPLHRLVEAERAALARRAWGGN